MNDLNCRFIPKCPPIRRHCPQNDAVFKIIRSDWNATSGEGLILNKPDLNLYATKEYVNEKIAHLPSGGGAVLSDWNEEDEMSYAYILNKPELHTAMTNEEIENLLN